MRSGLSTMQVFSAAADSSVAYSVASDLDIDVATQRKSALENLHEKEKELREFYKQPFSDSSERWWNAEFQLDYMRFAFSDQELRKDKINPSARHMIDLLLRAKWHVKAGILPRRVTYEIVNYKDVLQKKANPIKKEIDPEWQSIERLFCAITDHDLDEDYPFTSRENMREIVSKRIYNEAPPSLHEMLLRELEGDCESMEMLTFGRKDFAFPGSNEVIKIPTHGNDINRYRKALETRWVGMAAKAPDRVDGLNRFGPLPIFTQEKNERFKEETANIFMYSQTLEHMMVRYPELQRYFNMVNAKINVGLRCFGAIVSIQNESLPWETAEIDITPWLPDALQDHAYADPQTWDFTQMLKGFNYELGRDPRLVPLVAQIEEQTRSYFRNVFGDELETALQDQRVSDNTLE